MFCKHCGREINDNAVICVHCGVPTENMAGNYAPNTVQQQPALPTNGFAIAGLVLSLIGLFGGNYLILIPSILGLIFSIIGMAKSKTRSLPGLAIAALIVSIISLIFWGIVWIVAFEMIFGIWDGEIPTY